MHRYNQLTPEEARILEKKGTEPPSRELLPFENPLGIYVCKKCDAPLYLSSHKFHSACGWPSFEEEIPNSLKKTSDGNRTEILCHFCKGHLGHFFTGEGFTVKNTRHCVNSLSIRFISAFDEMGFPKALFAAGCFWSVEYAFKKHPGVIQTKVGYTGGHVVNPTYEEVCSGLTEHVEAAQVSFDPAKTTYEELVTLFLKIHDPSQDNGQGPDIGTQYLSRIFYFTESQRQTALKILGNLNRKIATKVLPASIFYPAEEYHQDYCRKQNPKPRDLK